LVYPRRFGIDSQIDTKLITDIQFYLDHAMNRASHSMFRRSRDSGLSFSQMVILRKLNWHGDASASELSEFLEISKAALSQAVDKLADLGLVERLESESDRRVKIHRITEKGRQLVADIHSERYDWLKEELEGLSPSEAELLSKAFELLSKERPDCAENGDSRKNPGERKH
jgi:DNA-binding MarR family transcriptional regulator